MSKFIFALLFFATTLLAHKVNLFVTHENNTVNIYSYFASGDACKGCNLIIKNENNIILKEKLNAEGKFQFVSEYSKLSITVDASSGHLVTKNILLDTLPQENLAVVLKEEKEGKYLKIFFSLLLIVLFFYGLKWIKKDA